MLVYPTLTIKYVKSMRSIRLEYFKHNVFLCVFVETEVLTSDAKK